MFRLPVDAQRAVAVGVGRDLDILLAVDDMDDPGALFGGTQLGCPNVLVEFRLIEEVGSWVGNAGFEIQLPVVRGLRTPPCPEAFVRLEDDLVWLFLDWRGRRRSSRTRWVSAARRSYTLLGASRPFMCRLVAAY
jgi:hypothetical protein